MYNYHLPAPTFLYYPAKKHLSIIYYVVNKFKVLIDAYGFAIKTPTLISFLLVINIDLHLDT